MVAVDNKSNMFDTCTLYLSTYIHIHIHTYIYVYKKAITIHNHVTALMMV